MFIDELREYCITKPNVTESFPFGPSALVFKVHKGEKYKMFAIIDIDKPEKFVNLKNFPNRNIELREQHEGITGAFHMDKRTWNSVRLDMVPDKLIKELIDDSYTIVVRIHRLWTEKIAKSVHRGEN